MKWNDSALEHREFEFVVMELSTYCTISTCQTLLKTGEAAKKYDGATFAHTSCPSTPFRNFAAHKQPNSGMRFGQ